VTAANYDRQRRYERRKASESADIGKIPDVVDPERREACRLDLHRHLVTYYPQSTGLRPFSKGHIRAIKRIEYCVLSGGRFVEAVYRGWAKTTIAENTLQWATLFGHRKFVAIFGSDAGSGERNIDSIKMELSENDLLYDDFPEVCHPIRALEGKPQRCAGQTFTVMVDCPTCQDQGPSTECDECKGKGQVPNPRPTHIEWTSDTLVLPTVPGSIAAGAIITARGLTAASRGLKYKRADGTQQRPDFVFIDDPQTDESAASPSQVQKRLGIIKKNILKLGGHNRQIAAVVAATVIQPDDMVAILLDPKKSPAWQGERIPMIEAWADAHETLWLGEYARIRTTYDADVPGSQQLAQAAATKFYKANQAAMDKGCRVAWEHCYDHDTELSAIQHAYNLLIDDGPEVFASECQNQPIESGEAAEQLKADTISKKAVRIARGRVPHFVTHLAAFVDVQDNLLYGGILGFGGGFRAHVVHYATYPDQGKSYFAYRDAKKTLKRQFAAEGNEAAIRAGLEAFVEDLLGTRWIREDEVEMRVGVCLVDAGDGDHSDIVYEFCRRSRWAPILRPSKGRYAGASSMPWELFPKREGEQLGHHWLIAPLPKAKAVRLTHFDTNYWKTFVAKGLAQPVGSPRGLELFDGDHQLLADHLTAEFGIKTRGRGREVTEWKCRPGRDNHYLDVVTGCFVGASMLGVAVAQGGSAPRKKGTKRRRAAISAI
jgi:hypothetical protein